MIWLQTQAREMNWLQAHALNLLSKKPRDNDNGQSQEEVIRWIEKFKAKDNLSRFDLFWFYYSKKNRYISSYVLIISAPDFLLIIFPSSAFWSFSVHTKHYLLVPSNWVFWFRIELFTILKPPNWTGEPVCLEADFITTPSINKFCWPNS